MDKRYERNIGTLTKSENDKLKDFKVCIVGCGGLGGYVIEMLSRIGIGYLKLVDEDIFDVSNLNRQILCNENNIGQNKVIEAKERIKLINNNVNIDIVSEHLDSNNCEKIINNCHVVIDALDNIKTRFVLQKYCETLNIPLIHGAISGWYGQVSTIYPGDNNLEDIYKYKKEIDNKLGNPSFTPGLVASIQVSETIKVLLNKGEILRNKVLFIDLLYGEYNIIEMDKTY
ncbi:HesA/MoeB/ThiF family protein [Romboutsia sp. 1001713B170131_170501_G6]|uniref:HesA/MoeB/ThiF family protein n=1 Tax=Romboutsia sp. 1001713B170131_170501_G6 TaxID=2787108 RepID=UPI001FADA121|nr:HesA/MoeB/ThiF family protein [Romboutsia sp. 1001713B170131_170501_G6]